jgi:hypothetical protein
MWHMTPAACDDIKSDIKKTSLHYYLLCTPIKLQLYLYSINNVQLDTVYEVARVSLGGTGMR